MIETMMFICVPLLFLIDFLLKESVEANIKQGEERRILKGKVLLRKVYNEGMAFNTLDQYPAFVRWSSTITGGFFGIYYVLQLLKKGNYMKKLAMTFFIGGALSNIYDRIVRKKVVDYFGFETKWKKIRNITFNLGDFFIFAGTFLYIVTAVFRRKK